MWYGRKSSHDRRLDPMGSEVSVHLFHLKSSAKHGSFAVERNGAYPIVMTSFHKMSCFRESSLFSLDLVMLSNVPSFSKDVDPIMNSSELFFTFSFQSLAIAFTAGFFYSALTIQVLIDMSLSLNQNHSPFCSIWTPISRYICLFKI